MDVNSCEIGDTLNLFIGEDIETLRHIYGIGDVCD